MIKPKLEPEGLGVSLYVVYDHPKDHPNHWVVRRQKPMIGGSIWYDPNASLYTDLADLRADLVAQGLTCMARDDNDDPVILETWI